MAILHNETIKRLSNTPSSVPVSNFLATLDGMTYEDAIQNLKMDARLYRWTEETITAIFMGIQEYYERWIP